MAKEIDTRPAFYHGRRQRPKRRIVDPDHSPSAFIKKKSKEDVREQVLAEFFTLITQEERAPKERGYSSTGDIREMMNLYSDTPEYERVLAEYTERVAKGVSSWEALPDFLGAVFEDMSYRIVKAEAPEGIVVLSPFRAYQLTRTMNPHAPEYATGSASTRGLGRAYTPDGFLVSVTDSGAEIIASLEYTVLANQRHSDKSFRSKYERFKETRRIHDVFSPAANMLIVKTEGSIIPEIVNKPDVALIRLGFTSSEFGDALRDRAGISAV